MDEARAQLERVEAEQAAPPFAFRDEWAARNAWTPPTEEDADDADLADFAEEAAPPLPERGRDPLTDALLDLRAEVDRLPGGVPSRAELERLKAEWLPRLRGMREGLTKEASEHG